MTAVCADHRADTVKEAIVEEHRQHMLMERIARQQLAEDAAAWKPLDDLSADVEVVQFQCGFREQLAAMIDEFPRAIDWPEFQVLVLRVCAEDGCRTEDTGTAPASYVEGRCEARRWLVQQVQTNRRGS